MQAEHLLQIYQKLEGGKKQYRFPPPPTPSKQPAHPSPTQTSEGFIYFVHACPSPLPTQHPSAPLLKPLSSSPCRESAQQAQ